MNKYLQVAIGDEFLWVAIGLMCAPLVFLLLVVVIDTLLDNIIDAITNLPYHARFRHYLKNYMFEKVFHIEPKPYKMKRIRRYIKSFSYSKIEQIINDKLCIMPSLVLDAFCLDSVKQEDYFYYDKLADYFYYNASFHEKKNGNGYITLFDHSFEDVYARPFEIWLMIRHDLEKKGKQMLSYSDFFVYVYKRKYKSREDRANLRTKCDGTWETRFHILKNLEKECKEIC